MDNFTASPGIGGDTFAADEISGVKYPRSKIGFGSDGAYVDVDSANPLPVDVGTVPVTGTFWQATQPVSGPVTDAQLRAAALDTTPQATGAAFWPGYKGVSDTAQEGLNRDPGGALITRGAVTTDEGTFRVNFANTSLAVSIGSVTVSGNTVTGSGFLAADVNYHDYFKLDADPESAWSQIDYVVDDTTIMLTNAYTGGASGAASRALVVPVTQTGGGYSVASGQLTMTSGTTSGGGVIIGRIMDYGPLVYRARLSISQRVANNETRIGFAEPVTITQPRWTARFIADGTTSTTITCESSRNPTTAPSAAEKELTVVTIPNGRSTNDLLDYRIEQLTESVRFYISGVLVAEHSKVMPSQSDVMVASVRSYNTAVPASSTTVVVDFMTVKNHNKLEIGVMSETERILASQVPMQEFTYNVAGVIAINTVLTQIDCSQIRSLNIQCVSMGTTGVVTPEWSNNGVNWITATLISETGATSTTFNAAALRSVNVRAKYFRLRMSTATTAGTTTIVTTASQTDSAPIVATQLVQGSGNFSVQGVAAHDAAVSGNPLRLAGRALTANYTAVATGDTADLVTTLVGALVGKPYSIPEGDWQYAAASGGIVNTTDVAVKAAAAAGIRNYVTAIQLRNTNAVATEFVIKDGATVIWRSQLPASMAGSMDITFPTPLRGTAATAVNVACITTGAAVYANLQGYIAP